MFFLGGENPLNYVSAGARLRKARDPFDLAPVLTSNPKPLRRRDARLRPNSRTETKQGTLAVFTTTLPLTMT